MHPRHIHAFKRTAGRALAFALISSFALCAGTSRADDAADDAAYYRSVVEAGKSKLEAGKLDEALAELQQAVLSDPTQSDGFFYLAVATFRQGDHAAALEYANSALAVAKGDEKSRTQELVNAIRKAKETEELARAGDEANGKGLLAKAADLYARAFQLSPERGDIGLKAASLYGNRLGRLSDAAVLYQKVIASGDATAAEAAGAELGALHEKLQNFYREEFPRAVERRDLDALEKLSQAFPHEMLPRLEAAALYAANAEGETVAERLGEAVKLGATYEDVKARVAFLDLWEKADPHFRSFIGDAFGPDATADMNQRMKVRQDARAEAQRKADEKARADQLAREQRARDEQRVRDQNAREEASRPLRAQLRAPVVAELGRLLQASPVKRIGHRATAKFFGGYEKNYFDYHLSIGLQGDRYVVKASEVFEHWKYPGSPSQETRTYTLESFSAMTSATAGPVYSPENQKGYGPVEKLYRLVLQFQENTITRATWASDSPGGAETERTSSVSELFIINDPADRSSIEALFARLKEIDSLTLDQLRGKAGGG